MSVRKIGAKKLRLQLRFLFGKSESAKVMFQIHRETHLKLHFFNIFLVNITTSILMLNSNKDLPLRKSFQNPQIAFYLKQMDKLNWKSELNMELVGLIFFQS